MVYIRRMNMLKEYRAPEIEVVAIADIISASGDGIIGGGTSGGVSGGVSSGIIDGGILN